jgi:hypothetical protein
MWYSTKTGSQGDSSTDFQLQNKLLKPAQFSNVYDFSIMKKEG